MSEKLAEKCFKKEENIVELNKYYQTSDRQIKHQLTLQNYVSVMAKIKFDIADIKDHSRLLHYHLDKTEYDVVKN